MLSKRKTGRIHFLGIGGAGMSCLALFMKKQGWDVSGCDIDISSPYLLSLDGIEVMHGHSESHVENVDMVVYSNAIPSDNPELQKAFKRGIDVLPRSLLLKEIFNEYNSIGVSGTHGKTTTTSIIAFIMEKVRKFNPTIFIGGKLRDIGGNAKVGSGKWLVAEVDESDGFISKYCPYVAVITNIDFDHVDRYSSIYDVKEVFTKYVTNLKSGGAFVFYGADKMLSEIAQKLKACRRDVEVISYGFGTDFDFGATSIVQEGRRTGFKLWVRGKAFSEVLLGVPGGHNVLNALASIAVADFLGISLEKVSSLLFNFVGAERRFQILGEKNGILVVSDYAHHPEEVKKVIETARGGWPTRRILVLFQPHRYTRLKCFYKEFAKVLCGADVVMLLPVYAASEKKISGVDEVLVYNEIRKLDAEFPVFLSRNYGSIQEMVLKYVCPGDILIAMGAGDIDTVISEIYRSLV